MPAPPLDPVLAPEEAARALARERPLSVIDATWTFPGGPKPACEGSLSNAIVFDLDAVSDASSPLPHMAPPPRTFRTFLAAALADAPTDAGATPLAVYDRMGVFSAPRFWWMARLFGYSSALVSVVDGGLPACRHTTAFDPAPARPARTSDDPARAGTLAFLTPRPWLLAMQEDVAAAITDPDTVVIDARPPRRFFGEEPEPRPGLRAGHIPGARNVPWSTTLTPQNRLHAADALTDIFAAAGVDLEAPNLIVTCGSGVTACVVALALARLGRWDAAVYDGSWAEWGRPDGPPLETGAPR